MAHIRSGISLAAALVVLLQTAGVVNAQTITSQSQATADQNGVYAEQIPYYDTTYPSCSSTAASQGGVASTGTVTTDLQSFVDTYGQAAFDVGKSSGIPYDAILAHASVESNNGQSKLNQVANNFFGIKAGSSWTGPTVTMPTNEQGPNGMYTVNGVFRVFASPQAGFQGYVDFLKSFPRYANVFNYQHDPIGYFQALKNDGYMTSDSAVTNETSRLAAIQKYIASKNLFPPSSQVQYDVQPSGGGTGGSATQTANSTTGSCANGSTGATGNGSGVVAVALAQLGNHYQPYTNGRTENWCADFVSWVYKTAGKPFSPAPGVAMSDGWQIQAVSSMKTYLQTKGQFWPKSATAPAPQPGDIVIYENGMSHTNIVAEANGYMVKTVGGNQESYNMTQSVVSESKGFIDIRNDPTVTGWGRLP